MEFDSRDMALTAVFGGLYAAINIVQTTLGGPITYGPVQLRIADCLIALAALFGWPLVAGVTLGCLVSNLYYLPSVYGFAGSLVFIDAFAGPLANLVAAALVLSLRKHRLLACVCGALAVGVIVGSYLWLLFLPPETLAFLPVPIAMVASISISSLLMIAGIGYGLLRAFSREAVVKPLKSRGLKILA